MSLVNIYDRKKKILIDKWISIIDIKIHNSTTVNIYQFLNENDYLVKLVPTFNF